VWFVKGSVQQFVIKGCKNLFVCLFYSSLKAVLHVKQALTLNVLVSLEMYDIPWNFPWF
jgi:hypothetical protein